MLIVDNKITTLKEGWLLGEPMTSKRITHAAGSRCNDCGCGADQAPWNYAGKLPMIMSRKGDNEMNCDS